jgi:AcrR family transcriptional regulator
MSKKETLLPTLVSAFAEMGYRRATTAALAKRCEVQETILYRIWADKKAMFVDAIDYVAENTLRIYREVLKSAPDATNPVGVLVNYEATHLGEFRNYRIVFSALPECNDPEVRQALQRMYHRIHVFIVEIMARSVPKSAVNIANMSWGIIGLGTIITIMNELNIMNAAEREQVFKQVAALMIDQTGSEH